MTAQLEQIIREKTKSNKNGQTKTPEKHGENIQKTNEKNSM